MKSIVDRIKELQSNQGLTNNDFAEKLGISSAALSHIYSGRNNPSLTILEAILQKFPNVNFNYLLKGEGMLFEQLDQVKERNQHSNRDLFSFFEKEEMSVDSSNTSHQPPDDPLKTNNDKESSKFTIVKSQVHESKVVKVALFMSDGKVFFYTPIDGHPFQ